MQQDGKNLIPGTYIFILPPYIVQQGTAQQKFSINVISTCGKAQSGLRHIQSMPLIRQTHIPKEPLLSFRQRIPDDQHIGCRDARIKRRPDLANPI